MTMLSFSKISNTRSLKNNTSAPSYLETNTFLGDCTETMSLVFLNSQWGMLSKQDITSHYPITEFSHH